MKRFIVYGADPNLKNSQGQSLVHIAAESGFESILVYLCREIGLSYTDTDSNGRTPLHIAALEGQTNTGILLIAWSSDLNQIDMEGFTPLHLAALSQNYRLARNLVIRRAKTNLRDVKGELALDIAINRGCLEIVKLLVYYI